MIVHSAHVLYLIGQDRYMGAATYHSRLLSRDRRHVLFQSRCYRCFHIVRHYSPIRMLAVFWHKGVDQYYAQFASGRY